MKGTLREITTVPEFLSAAPCVCISSAPVPLSSCERGHRVSVETHCLSQVGIRLSEIRPLVDEDYVCSNGKQCFM